MQVLSFGLRSIIGENVMVDFAQGSHFSAILALNPTSLVLDRFLMVLMSAIINHNQPLLALQGVSKDA